MTNLSSGHMFDYAYKLTVFSRVQGKFTTYELYEIYKKYHFVNVFLATKHLQIKASFLKVKFVFISMDLLTDNFKAKYWLFSYTMLFEKLKNTNVLKRRIRRF